MAGNRISLSGLNHNAGLPDTKRSQYTIKRLSRTLGYLDQVCRLHQCCQQVNENLQTHAGTILHPFPPRLPHPAA
jgi:hypothetical protein